MHFLLTCKNESHPWIAEQVRYAEPETYERREWNHRNHLVYRYRWVRGIENRAEGEKLPVNYLYCEIYNNVSISDTVLVCFRYFFSSHAPARYFNFCRSSQSRRARKFREKYPGLSG
jgi:hypothetical protein